MCVSRRGLQVARENILIFRVWDGQTVKMAVNFTTDGRYTTIMDAKMYVYSMYTRIALEIKPVLLTHRGASTELEEQQPHDHRRGAGLESQDTGGNLFTWRGKQKASVHVQCSFISAPSDLFSVSFDSNETCRSPKKWYLLVSFDNEVCIWQCTVGSTSWNYQNFVERSIW